MRINTQDLKISARRKSFRLEECISNNKQFLTAKFSQNPSLKSIGNDIHKLRENAIQNANNLKKEIITLKQKLNIVVKVS